MNYGCLSKGLQFLIVTCPCKRFPREYAGFTMPEYQALNGYRQTVPEYVKDYVPVNVYMR